jgi:hypothetical protein
LNDSQNQPGAGENRLLRSLGNLARGLSALFWGLPATLIACTEAAKADSLRPVEMIPAMVGNCILLFGLWRMGDFQQQERPWRQALDRATLLALVNLGLCPFLYWQNKMPTQVYFAAATSLLVLSSLLLLFNLNIVLRQLGAMLPDETLRHETREFTAFNRWLLVLWLFFITAALLALHYGWPDRLGPSTWVWVERSGVAMLLFLGLTPLAVTMALIWKTKEVIFDGVFRPH